MRLGDRLASAAAAGKSEDAYSCDMASDGGKKKKRKKCKKGILADLNKGSGMSRRKMSSAAKQRLKGQKKFKRR
jgi:hypothetical protein